MIASMRETINLILFSIQLTIFLLNKSWQRFVLNNKAKEDLTLVRKRGPNQKWKKTFLEALRAGWSPWQGNLSSPHAPPKLVSCLITERLQSFGKHWRKSLQQDLCREDKSFLYLFLERSLFRLSRFETPEDIFLSIIWVFFCFFIMFPKNFLQFQISKLQIILCSICLW